MNLESLKLFVQLAELGSMTKVAFAQDCIQSVISRRVTAIERECGAKLFYRTGRGVALTDFAEAMLPRIKALLADAEQISNEMKAGAGVPIGEVRIGLLPSLSSPTIQTLFRRIHERFPGVLLHIFEGSNGQIDEWLNSGRVDIGILFRYGGSVANQEQVLGVVDTYLVGKAGDRLTSKPTIEFDKLSDVPLVLPGAPNGLRLTLEQFAKRANINLRIVMEADSLPLQKEFAASGCAYAVLGGHAISREVNAGILQASRIIDAKLVRTVVLATTTQRPLSHAGREVGKELRLILDDLFANKTFK
ncbi:LysR family transcriptional regulator [Rhodoferax sp.]|uniref:LysR family transcriptional regulator n=1 Tax=Rhodoferax sp. TaxID=50421 RepID=UPI002622236B|nr:LysR family transcriptional regulator [Rhodoferax sp.]MDD3937631.1 LysR family transcriptional regulator [Rhodoferax sp.]